MSVDCCTVQNTVLRNMCAHVQVHMLQRFTRGFREEEGKEILLDMKDKRVKIGKIGRENPIHKKCSD